MAQHSARCGHAGDDVLVGNAGIRLIQGIGARFIGLVKTRWSTEGKFSGISSLASSC
jgi:hypothetical protein